MVKLEESNIFSLKKGRVCPSSRLSNFMKTFCHKPSSCLMVNLVSREGMQPPLPRWNQFERTCCGFLIQGTLVCPRADAHVFYNTNIVFPYFPVTQIEKYNVLQKLSRVSLPMV